MASDLDSFADKLMSKIYGNESKVLFDEVVKCLRAEALRSAYMMTWVAIAESIKAKFKEMSFRDREVEKVVGQIENSETNQRPVDSLLVKKAKEIGLISPDFVERVEHVYKMRCIYAHPYQTAPSEEEVQAAMVIAVDGILSQPPFLRHGYIHQLLDNIFTIPHFLDDDQSKIKRFAEEISRKIHPDLHGYLFKSLCKRLEGIVEDPDTELYIRRALHFSVGYIDAVNANLNEDEWASEELLLSCPRAASKIFSHPNSWNRINERLQDMVVGILLPSESSGGSEPIRELRSCSILYSEGSLTGRQVERFKEAIDNSSLELLVNSNIPLDLYGHVIISRLKKYDWYIQNPAIDLLRKNVGAEEVGKASAELQEQLGRNILQAADGNSKAAKNFLVGLLNGREKWSFHFVKGVLFESFIDDENRLRFKKKSMYGAIMGVIRGCDDDTAPVFEELVDRMGASEAKGTLTFYDFDEVDKVFEKVLKDLGGEYEKFKGVVEKLKSTLFEWRESNKQSILGDEEPPI